MCGASVQIQTACYTDAMLIIGHRGAAGIKPENTIAGLRAAIESGADMVEFDVRLTKDKVPVLSHDFHMLRSHNSAAIIRQLTLAELQKRTAGSDKPLVTLDAALKETFGKILVNIEIKQSKSASAIYPIVTQFARKKSDWQLLIFSSFSPAALGRMRELAPHAQLALLHHLNPFLFVRHMRKLQLAAVGFHRLNVNKFSLNVARRLGIFTYAYTVNRPDALHRLAEQGFDGVVTDRPDILVRARNKIEQL